MSRGRLALPASDLTQYYCKSFAMQKLCDNMINKPEHHENDAAKNVPKFNNLPLSFLCESHSQAIKLINRIFATLTSNAKKHVNNQVRREVVDQFKQRQRKRRRT